MKPARHVFVYFLGFAVATFCPIAVVHFAFLLRSLLVVFPQPDLASATFRSSSIFSTILISTMLQVVLCSFLHRTSFLIMCLLLTNLPNLLVSSVQTEHVIWSSFLFCILCLRCAMSMLFAAQSDLILGCVPMPDSRTSPCLRAGQPDAFDFASFPSVSFVLLSIFLSTCCCTCKPAHSL